MAANRHPHMCSKFADLAIVPRSIVKHCIHAGCAEHALRDDSFFYADDAPWKVARRHLCGPDAIVQGDSAPHPNRIATRNGSTDKAAEAAVNRPAARNRSSHL